LACNQIPEIDGDDAVWRRFRIIDFNSKFVDNPERPNEYKKDFTIPTRIKEDPSFKKGLINLLIKYYYNPYTDVPPQVLARTQEYIQDNQEIHNWCQEHIITSPENILKLNDIFEYYRATYRDANRKHVTINIKKYFTTTLGVKYKTGIRNSETNQKESGYQHFDLV